MLSPEQNSRLRAIAAKIQDEKDRECFNVLIAQLIAVFEESDRQDVKKPSLATGQQVA